MAIAMMLGLLLGGCAAEGRITAEGHSADAEAGAVEAAPDIPAGFTDMGEIAIRPSTAQSTCSYDSCVWFELYAYSDCPTAVYVEGNEVDSTTGVIYGWTNDTTGILRAGDRAMVELVTEAVGADAVTITEASCY